MPPHRALPPTFLAPLPLTPARTSFTSTALLPARTPRAHRATPTRHTCVISPPPTTPPSTSPPLFVPSKTFGSLGIPPILIQALTALSITHPTRIQSKSIPPILSNSDVIIASATGSGKTLAYLLPLVTLLKQAEQLHPPTAPPLRVPHRPRAVILLPTRELVHQVLSVAKSLAHHAKLRVVALTGGQGLAGGRGRDKAVLAYPVDVLVTTTGRLTQLMRERTVDLRYVEHVVVDEVDTLVDEGFGAELRGILAGCRRWPKGAGEEGSGRRVQCVLVGATHPKAAEEVYREEFAGAVRVEVDLHRVPEGLEERFVRVEGKGKVGELMGFLGECGREQLAGGRMMVFCNTVESCRFVGHVLGEAGYRVGCIHGDVPGERRETEYGMFRDGGTQVLVCTDMGARGLDNLRVDHVVLFDFPTSAVDYLHRAGRTARAGGKGRVTSFVMKRDLQLAGAIERAGKGRVDTLEWARRVRMEEEERRRQRKREMELEKEREELEGESDVVERTTGRRGGASGSAGRGRSGGTGSGGRSVGKDRGRGSSGYGGVKSGDRSGGRGGSRGAGRGGSRGGGRGGDKGQGRSGR